MKFSIARSELLEALSTVGKGMSARSTLPILSGILVVASGGEIQLQATDLEVSIRSVVPALVESEGQTVLPGKLLSDIVRNLPEAAVTIEVEGEVAHVRCQQSSFTVKALNPGDFPKFPEVAIDKQITIPAETLSAMVKQVSRAVSRDETRAVLTGILFSIDGPGARMVATDSYRLAVREVVLEEKPGEDTEVVIPGKALEEVTRLAGDGERVLIGVNENQIIFEFGSTVFVTRRIEGSFPNYKQLIPKAAETTAIISREEFSAAVKRVSLMALHNTALRISVNVADQTLSLSATTQDVGDASEDLMVKAEGNDVVIAFNHGFLMDGINSANAETVRLEVETPLKPGLLKTEGDDGFLYLLMPVRIG
ncbi:MAG: DNA polymerase III subunit beta [Coriobacteriia bacterium]|nr:DNA polymerase III subunit beta [Coriobacteriia bacterium]